MKKIFLIVALCLFMYGNGNASDNAPVFSKNSINSNLLEHKWEVWKVNDFYQDKLFVEIYTLIKHDWILKCQIKYYDEGQITTCTLP